VSSPTTTAVDPEFLRQELQREQAKSRWLELRVKDLEAQLYGRKSERRGGLAPDDNLAWEDLLTEAQALAPAAEAVPVAPTTRSRARERVANGTWSPAAAWATALST